MSDERARSFSASTASAADDGARGTGSTGRSLRSQNCTSVCAVSCGISCISHPRTSCTQCPASRAIDS